MLLHVISLWALIVQINSLVYVNEVILQQTTPFPIELGRRIHWRIFPKSGNAYDNSGGVSIFLGDKVLDSWTPECVSHLDAKAPRLAVCEVGKGPVLDFYFTPLREHYGLPIRIVFYPTASASFAGAGQVLLNTTVQLTKQPSYLDMTIRLEREPDSVHQAPSELNLSPPIFLDGSLAALECSSDGALPPQAISLSAVCEAPPRATVEAEREAKAQLGYPYEAAYAYYGFRAPPSDEELAAKMALAYAASLLKEARIARSADNRTLSASLPINSKAHDCSLYCRLAGKERQIKLTVYYVTTLAYILPAPTDGLMRVGSSMTCHADGFPEPTVTLSLRQPMRQVNHGPLLNPVDVMVTTSPMPPLEQIVDNSDVAMATRIGLRPDEYSIRGARFTLGYNATPGVELLLVCTAGNALPNQNDFMGANKTITVTRFTVAGGIHYMAIAYSSIGIVVSICLAILFCAIVIILLMVYLRRRQKYTSNAIQARHTVSPGGYAPVNTSAGTVTTGVNGAKAAIGKQGSMASGDYTPGSKTNRKLRNLRATFGSRKTSADPEQESPYHGLLNRSQPQPPPPPVVAPTAAAAGSPSIANSDGVEYAELAFSPTVESARRGIQVAAASSTLGRIGSAGHLRRAPRPGAGSASMQTLPRSHTTATAQGEEDGGGGTQGDNEGNYTEIIGVLQPKAYTSQLVLKQQQEATQAILGMHSNSPSVFV